jgi:hypothetical protein
MDTDGFWQLVVSARGHVPDPADDGAIEPLELLDGWDFNFDDQTGDKAAATPIDCTLLVWPAWVLTCCLAGLV